MNEGNALMTGQVWHWRQASVAHHFVYPMSLVMLDLARPGKGPVSALLWGRRWRPLALRDGDYISAESRPLLDKVRERAALEGLDFRGGRIWMLAQPRALGFVFNPIVLYFHIPEGSRAPDAVMAEVRNTPWGERHFYGHAESEPLQQMVFEQNKAFHVSPFLPMQLRYHWRIDWAEPLRVRIEARDGARTVFAAGMSLNAVDNSGASRTRALLRLLAQGVSTRARIYRQALRLWRRGARVHRHPDKIV